MNNKQARRKEAIMINVAPSEILPAAELIANNVDLLMEILLRLPAESTIRFKIVSKHWLSLLSDSGFVPNHCSQNPRPSISGLYFYFDGTLSSVSLQGGRHDLPSLSFLKSKIGATHSCNGLLLCYVTTINGDFRGYIVCNPTTKKHTLLPKPVGLVGGWDGYLAFDPTKSPHQYKVVSLRYGTQEIDVYSSQSLRWKKIIPDQKYDGVCAFWNGAIHWLTDDHFLKRFDVDGEEMIAMPNPPSPKIFSPDEILYFGECGDDLILIQSRSWCPSGFRILELERDYSGWVVKCRVNLRPLISVFPEMEWKSYNDDFDGYAVLGAVKGDNERGFALLLATPRRIISYNPMYKTWNVLRNLVPRESYEFGMNIYAFPFMATLFPV
ncbi:F-box protein At5g07610-like [Rhododendron vialii]|uniref:F-box protein At5g07610-like n=1 Tax=Rhododendron vialii TaxID=182163 RepID=UPI00265E948E|nr:F-box protein At5g07610-like [Rhododendron vialii]